MKDLGAQIWLSFQKSGGWRFLLPRPKRHGSVLSGWNRGV
jgi:hypothetical protein